MRRRNPRLLAALLAVVLCTLVGCQRGPGKAADAASPRAGIRIIMITHGQAGDPYHAYPVGDRFTVLGHGHSYGTFTKDEVSREDVLELMAGGEDRADVGADDGADFEGELTDE